MIGSMEIPREDPNRRRAQDEMEVKEAEKRKKNRGDREPSPPCVLSLDDEFKQLQEGDGEREEKEREINEETLLENIIEERSEGDRSEGEETEEEGEEENWNLEEEIHLEEKMMAVRMEVEMMQKEKENWEKERKSLKQDKVDARAQRETLEQ